MREHDLGEDLRAGLLERELMPLRRPEPIPVPDLEWSPGGWQRVRRGVRAMGMDEKWNVYLDGDPLMLHRSWTARCIYQVAVERVAADRWRPVRALVESDSAAGYRRTMDEGESAFLELFLRTWYTDEVRDDLWQRYEQERRRRPSAEPRVTDATR